MLLFGVAGAAVLTTAAVAGDNSVAIDALISSYQKLGLFNGSVLVAERGKVILKKGYGLANAEWGIPNTPDTVFRLASVSKQFTAMLVMQLVEEGKLTLDSRLSEVLPYYRKDTGSRVTIHNLLNHTSGIPNFLARPGFVAENGRKRWPVEEFVTKFCSDDLQFEPGSKFTYSNSGYYILGAVIEKLAGKPFEQVLAERITGPLGMRSTGYEHSERVVPKRASGYERTPEGLRNAQFIEMSVAFAAGGLVSTVEDLYLWDQALYTDKLLSPKLKQVMFTPGLENYAYGWGVRQAQVGPKKEDRTLQSHAGGIFGFATFIRRVVEDRHLVVLLNNTGETGLDAMTMGIIDILYGRTPPPPKRPIGDTLAATITQKGVDAAVAQYRDLKHREKDSYDFGEEELNRLGYQLLGAAKTGEAIAIFKINVEAYPESWNVYDSLAEGYANAGQKELAIKNYARSLELNPGNRNAVEQLAKLTKP